MLRFFFLFTNYWSSNSFQETRNWKCIRVRNEHTCFENYNKQRLWILYTVVCHNNTKPGDWRHVFYHNNNLMTALHCQFLPQILQQAAKKNNRTKLSLYSMMTLLTMRTKGKLYKIKTHRSNSDIQEQNIITIEYLWV